MTADLTAIIEAAAEADYLAERAHRSGKGPLAWPDWTYLPNQDRSDIRDRVMPTITATLTTFRAEVLVALAESLEAQSKEYEARAETRNVLTEAVLRGADMGKAIAYMDAATQVRKALP